MVEKVIDGVTVTVPADDTFSTCLGDWESSRLCYRQDATTSADPTVPATAPSADAGTSPAAVTITDLVRFAPSAITVVAEPDNLGVVGLPTNLVADAPVTTQRAALFGHPVTVRFTPTDFTFVHGDDTIASAATGGASWAALQVPPFTPTDTSHIYRTRGTYDARVDVTYTAEVDLGAGWVTVPGTLTITGASQQLRIYEAYTALV
ncbi:MAG: hypothetical protein WA971_04145, partial [Microbacterium sp.]